MTVGEAIEFLKTHHRGVLVARRKDDSLQMTLVSPVVSGSNLIITARADTYKVKNIKRNPQVSLVVFGEEFHGSEYIQVDGTAEVIPQPEAMDMVLDWHRQVRGEPESWDEIRRKTLAENRIAIRMTIARVGPQNRK